MVTAVSILFLVSFSEVSAEENRNEEVGEGYKYYYVFTETGEQVNYEVYVTEGKEIDVYILTKLEKNDYEDGKDFNASKMHENILTVQSKYRITDNQTYYIVIDNQDNAHENDAIYEQDVTYDFIVDVVDSPPEEEEDDDLLEVILTELAQERFNIPYFSLLFLLIIIVGVAVVKSGKKEESQPIIVRIPKSKPKMPTQQVVKQEVHHHYAPQIDQSTHDQSYHDFSYQDQSHTDQSTQTITDSVYQHKEVKTPQPQQQHPQDNEEYCPQCGSLTEYNKDEDDYYCWTCDLYLTELLEMKAKKMSD